MNPRTIEILITKLGLTPVQAVWVMGLSEKHAIWIGNQIKAQPELYPSAGGEIKKILVWKKRNEAINLGDYDYKQAVEAVSKSEKTSFILAKGSLKNEKIVALCNGTRFKWVELKTEEDCVEEGRALRHCLRNSHREYLGRGKRLFSLRNEENKPVATLQIIGNKIGQYRSKLNREPDKSFAPLYKFLEEQVGLEVSNLSKFAYGLSNVKEKLPKLIKGHLVIEDGTGKALILPAGLKVTGNLEIHDTEAIMPKGLKVGGNLILGDSDQNKIPDGTVIGGDLVLDGFGLSEIDLKKVKIGGKIRF